MTSAALTFSGKIASGKTTIANYVAIHLHFPVASFGAFLRGQAITRGLQSPTREELQSLGVEYIGQGWDNFCLAVLRDAGWVSGQGIVIDGIRHLEALDAIQRIVAPTPICHVYVNISDTVRLKRLRERGIDPATIQKLEAHSTEEQVGFALAHRADIILDGAQPVEFASEPVFERLRHFEP